MHVAGRIGCQPLYTYYASTANFTHALCNGHRNGLLVLKPRETVRLASDVVVDRADTMFLAHIDKRDLVRRECRQNEQGYQSEETEEKHRKVKIGPKIRKGASGEQGRAVEGECGMGTASHSAFDPNFIASRLFERCCGHRGEEPHSEASKFAGSTRPIPCPIGRRQALHGRHTPAQVDRSRPRVKDGCSCSGVRALIRKRGSAPRS